MANAAINLEKQEDVKDSPSIGLSYLTRKRHIDDVRDGTIANPLVDTV